MLIWIPWITVILLLGAILNAQQLHSNNKGEKPRKTIHHKSSAYRVSLSKGQLINLARFSRLATKAHNKTRSSVVAKKLREAAGVYRNKTKASAAGTQRTVITTVIAFNSQRLYQYMVYFRNFLCYASQYDYDLVVYILHHRISNLEEQIQSLESLGVRVLTYPDSLLWFYIAGKTTQMQIGKIHATYKGEMPNFKEFGSLVMLIPVLEILEAGYNAIYLDVDMALVQDPVQFLTRGDADITMSLELRMPCPEIYPSNRRENHDWNRAEPNSGVMHVRATAQGVSLYIEWMKNIVKLNLVNDQGAFFRGVNNSTQFTPNCNWGSPSESTQRKGQNIGTFCFLPEMLFQNGLVAFQCNAKPIFRDNWYQSAAKQIPVNADGVRLPVTVHANYCNDKSHQLKVRGLWLFDDQAVPTNGSLVTTKQTVKDTDIEAHLLDDTTANITTTINMDTTTTTSATGLASGATVSVPTVTVTKTIDAVVVPEWQKAQKGDIRSESIAERARVLGCKIFNPLHSSYAKINWTKELSSIDIYRSKWLHQTLVNGTLIKSQWGTEVYLIDENLRKRAFPDGETFLKMGYDWDSSGIKSIPQELVLKIPDGLPFPSLAPQPPPPTTTTTITHHQPMNKNKNIQHNTAGQKLANRISSDRKGREKEKQQQERMKKTQKKATSTSSSVA